MSAVPSLVRCAETGDVLMKLALSNVYVMKVMNLLQMARIALVCMELTKTPLYMCLLISKLY